MICGIFPNTGAVRGTDYLHFITVCSQSLYAYEQISVMQAIDKDNS